MVGLSLNLGLSHTRAPAGENLYAASARVYVSSVSANGIPVGNDGTGTGTRANPYLTIDAAYTAAAAGKVLLLNGDSSSPTDYRHATFLSVAKNLTIDSVVPYGAKISSTTTTARVIHASVLGTLQIGKVIIDGRSLCPACITVPVGASATTLKLYGTSFVNYTDSITSPSALAKMVLDARGCIATTSNAVSGGFYGASLDTGSSVSIVGCTFNVTDQSSLSGRGVVQFRANVASLPCTVSSNSITMAIKAGLTGSGQHGGIVLYNFGATVTDNTISVSGNVTNHSGTGIVVSPDPSGAALNVSNSIVSGNTVSVTCSAGGAVVRIGQDTQGSGADAATSTGIQVYSNTVIGSAAFAAAGGHGILAGCPAISGAVIHSNAVNTIALALVDKVATSCEWHSNTVTNFTENAIRAKGSQGGHFHDNTATTSTAGITDAVVFVTLNDLPSATNSTGVVIEDNSLTVPGLAASGRMVDVEASQSATFAGNDYNGFAGATNPFQNGASNYASLAAWQAVEPTATGAP